MATTSSAGSGGLIKKTLTAILLVSVILFIICLIRALTLDVRTISGPECKPMDTDFIQADKKLVSRFQQSLRFETVSRNVGDFNAEELVKIREFIQKSYPVLHSSPLVKFEVVANYSLLYTVKGTNKDLTPYMLAGHLDVVPADPTVWEVPPFEGQIKDGFVYGRGALDDKHTVFGILEALEFLLKQGHKPQRPFYVGFGHDEELGGFEGAHSISQTLRDRGVQKLEYLLDEGLTVLDQTVISGLTVPVALVGTSEKGFLDVKLSVHAQGGHSSTPPKETTIGILAKAVTRLEDNPHPSKFGSGPEKGMVEHMAVVSKFPQKLLMANQWLFSPLLSWVMSLKPMTNAFIRTTTAVTIFNGGFKSNVLAPNATAIVNHRIHPSQSVQEVVEYDKYIINDPRVNMEIARSLEPLPLSPYDDDSFGYQNIKTSILQVWGYTGAVVAPAALIGNTDTHHYTQLTTNIYRFSPTYMYADDVPRFHGLNERLSIKNFEEAVNFFYHVIVNSDKKALAPMHVHGDEL